MPDRHTDAAAAAVPDAGDDTLRYRLIQKATVHRLITPVQCACGWREIDNDWETWAQHVVDELLSLIREHTASTNAREQARAERAEATIKRVQTFLDGFEDEGWIAELRAVIDGKKIRGWCLRPDGHDGPCHGEPAHEEITHA